MKNILLVASFVAMTLGSMGMIFMVGKQQVWMMSGGFFTFGLLLFFVGRLINDRKN